MKHKSQNNKYYISLGAGANQVPLIKAAKKLGYKVIGVDVNFQAPGLKYCDIKLLESIYNYRKIHFKLDLSMLDGPIVGGYCASFGTAITSWAYLAERYHLPHLSRTHTESLLNKYRVRKMLQGKIKNSFFSQPDFLTLESKLTKKQLDQLGYPLIIKSKLGASKKNIFQVNNYAEVKEVLNIANLKSLNLMADDIIIEQKIPGDEITVVGLIQDFQFELIQISDKITSKMAPFIELEHIFPSKYDKQPEKDNESNAEHDNLKQEIIDIHQEITKALQIISAPLVSEWKVFNKKLYLVELSVQVPGEFLGQFMIPEALKYNFYENLVLLTTGNPIQKVAKLKKGNDVSIKYFDKTLSAEKWKSLKEKAIFAHILNPKPLEPPQSNEDRYGVMGFVNPHQSDS